MQPIRAIGPYRILRSLGQGGMGVVYLAEHEASGARVALKTVRILDARLLAGIRREIRTLSRLRHPGIVPVVGEGLHDGVPWYAMELIEGQGLRQIMARYFRQEHDAEPTQRIVDADVPTARLSDEDLQASGARGGRRRSMTPQAGQGPRTPAAGGHLLDALGLVRGICAPLAHMHGEGLLHRDLKPENVIVRAGGEPVLVDFGLTFPISGEISREVLGGTGDPSGTLHYMAPEQTRGELCDARADLYSLGSILYELLTGRTPVTGDTLPDILQDIENGRVIPPSELVDDVPPELDALALRLLAKEPRRRLGYADVVASALDRIVEARTGASRAASIAVTAAPRPYLYRPRLAGRSAELQALRDRLASLRQRRGSFGAIVGESGAGKTRLALELAAEASRAGYAVDTGICLPILPPWQSGASGGAPLQPFRGILQAIADRCRELGRDEAVRLLGRAAPLLAPFEPAIAELDICRAAPEVVEIPPEAARMRLFRHLRRALHRLCDAEGRLLVLDDLQWADDLTLGFLSFLLRTESISDLPLFILATCRAEEVGPALERLLALPGAARITLRRLDGNAVRDIVGDMLAMDEAPADMVVRIFEQSEGNPLFASEYVRAAADEGVLSRDADGMWRLATRASSNAGAFRALPSSLRELMERRLDHIEGVARLALEAAAVLGRDIDERILGRVAELDQELSMDALAELLAHHVLEERSGRYEFGHDKLREVAYEAVAPERRLELHRRAALAIEAGPVIEKEQRWAEIGLHHERAGERREALSCYLAGARRALAEHAHAEAERLYRACLLMEDAPSSETGDARLELAECLTRRGAPKEAEQLCERVVADARALRDASAESAALRVLSEPLRMMGKIEATRTALEDAARIARHQHDTRREARALSALADTERVAGRLEEARALFEAAIAGHRACSDVQAEAYTTLNMGVLSHLQGRNDEAQAHYERALDLASSAGDVRAQAAALLNLGNLWAERGATDKARAVFEKSHDLLRRAGDRVGDAVLLGNLANLALEDGDRNKAKELFEKALAIHREAGARLSEARTIANLAHLIVEDEPGRAAELAETALGIMHESGDRTYRSSTLVALALALMSLGRPQRASEIASQALEDARALGAPHDEVMALLAQSRLARLFSHDRDAARAAAAQAEQIALRLGEPSLVAEARTELEAATKDP